MRQTDLLKKENSTIQAAVRQLQRKCACGQHTVGGGECAECGKKQQTLQRSAHSAEQTTPREAPPIVHATLRSSGQPLDANTRALMESRLGHDLSHVRVHTDERAAESARAVNALAYTVGRDIVIPSPYFQPGSSAGIGLLAHELTHVVQQAGNSIETPSALEISRPDDGAEREASEVGSSVHGQQTNHIATDGRVRLARQPAGGSPTSVPPAAPTPQELMDEANAIRMSLLSRAILQAHQVEIACKEKADPQLMVEAIPQEVRPFVSWLGTLPTESSFCSLVSWARALMIENQNMTVLPFFFAGPDDAFCNYHNHWPYAKYDDTQIKICPKTVDPGQTNPVLRALVLTHELFHAPLFQMDHPTPDVMNSEHCGSMGSFEAITNPYCMTNVIGHLAGGDRCVM
jgi:Domain of unknown function (DUF4157)